MLSARTMLKAGKGEGSAGAGLWEELLPGREAWLERGPCMGRGRLPAVLSDERLASALLWRTETAEMEKVRSTNGEWYDAIYYDMMSVFFGRRGVDKERRGRWWWSFRAAWR